MWKCEHSVELDATPAQIWAWYADGGKWEAWYPDLLEVRLDGPFVTGTTGVLRQDPAVGHHPEPVSFKLVGVVENESWTIDLVAPTSETGIADTIGMSSSASLTALPDGGVRVTHWVSLSGPHVEEIGAAIGDWISDSLSKGLEKLSKLVIA